MPSLPGGPLLWFLGFANAVLVAAILGVIAFRNRFPSTAMIFDAAAARLLQASGEPKADPRVLSQDPKLSALRQRLVRSLRRKPGSELAAAIRLSPAFAGTDIKDLLLARLRSPNSEIACGAADALSRRGDPNAVSAIAEFAESSKDRWRRIRALAALLRCRAAPVSIIQKLAEDDDPEIRAVAIDLLFRFRQSSFVPTVIQGLDDADAVVRRRALRYASLVEGSEIEQRLLRLTSDADHQVARAAVESILQIRTPRLLEQLDERLEDLPLPAVGPAVQGLLRSPLRDSLRLEMRFAKASDELAVEILRGTAEEGVEKHETLYADAVRSAYGPLLTTVVRICGESLPAALGDAALEIVEDLEDFEASLAALKIIERSRTTKALPALVRLVTRAHPALRPRALEVIRALEEAAAA